MPAFLLDRSEEKLETWLDKTSHIDSASKKIVIVLMSEQYSLSRNKPKEMKPDFPFGTKHKKCEAQHEEKALANYANWLLKRHAVQTKLLVKLQRLPGEYLMYYGDQLNQVKEEKAALEYTRIPQKFDKYRGNPEWWEPPPGLHNKCKLSHLTHHYVKTKVQKNEIPEIIKVGTPHFIRNEKMLNPSIRSVYKKWQDSSYRQQRVKELHSLLNNVEPHRPEFDKLIVIGKNAAPLPVETQTIPIALMQSNSFEKRKKETSVYDLSLRCCLKINGCFFYENSPSLLTSHKFNVFFDYDVQSHPLQRKFIVFENVGRVTIRISWSKLENFRIFRDFFERKNTEYFCFDKNMLILVPGQILNLPVWFRTTEMRTVVETWEITTKPKYWPETTKVFFVFQAQTCIENFTERIRNIKAKMNHRAKRRIIKEILEDLTRKTKYEDHRNIDYFYYEPELFEAMNIDGEKALAKPKYQYDASVVENLKQFYSEVRLHFHPKTWNLNVQDLLIMARIKDIIEYAEDRTCEFGQYRTMMATKSAALLGKESKVLSDLKTKTKVSSLEEESQKASFVQKETRYGKLMKMLWPMAPPSITPNKERLKYFQVYSILNAYFTLMSSDLCEIKTFPATTTMITRENYKNYQRLIFEEFDDTQLLRTKKTSGEDVIAQPKPEVLKDVSTSDVQMLHKLYFATDFHRDDSKGKSGKKIVKQADNNSSKGKLSHSSSRANPRTALDEKELVNSDFDPYEEVPYEEVPIPKKPTQRRMSVVAREEKIVKETEKEDEQEDSKIRALNIYVVIYSNLSEAVEAMVDTLESAKEYRVPLEDIEKLKTCFELHIEEEEGDEEEEPINPFTNDEEKEYFEQILRAHLNEVTGKYLVCGEKEPFTRKKSDVGFGEQKDIARAPDAPSIFSLYERVQDEIKYEERGQQTQPFECINESDLLFTADKRSDGCISEPRNSEYSSSNMFYYSDDEVFDDMSGREKNIVSEGSGSKINIPLESSKPVISLMDEWRKKKGSNSS